MHVSILKKIENRLCGLHMKYLLKTACHYCTHRDGLSFRCFLWALRSYFRGMENLGLNDYLGILAKCPNDADYITAGEFRFVNNEECLPALRAECDDILAEHVLSRKLEEYYRLFDAEGPYENGEVVLERGDIVIDAGANMGVFSVLAAAKGAAKVYAFEPMEIIHGILNKNIRANGYSDQITVVPAGLSDLTGSQTIFTSGGVSGVSSSSLVFAQQGGGLQAKFVSLDDWVEENGVPCIDFIKADIEGAERKLLTGAQETLKKFKPRLAICTYHLPDDPQVLEGLIKEAVPEYRVIQRSKKLFAYVPDEMIKDEQPR